MALAFLGMLLYQAWQEDYGPKPDTTAENDRQAEPVAVAGETPTAPRQADIDGAAPSVPGMDTTGTAGANTGLIKILTDTLDLVLDTRGGTIVDARLMQYPVAVDKPDEKYRLLSQRPSDYFIIQSGLLGAETERTPTH
mgnify:FL=1